MPQVLNPEQIQAGIAAAQTAADNAATAAASHAARTDNPHALTKSQIGLGNVDNTSDANKPISTLTQAALTTETTNRKQLDALVRPVPITQRNFFPNSVHSQTVSTETAATYRAKFPLNFEGGGLKLVYTNAYTVTGETLPPHTITVRARILWNSIEIPVYFRGSRTATIEPGGTVESDLIGFDIKPSTAAFALVDTYVSCGTPTDTTKLWPLNLELYSTNGEGRTLSSDLTTTGASAPTAANVAGYGPTLILGHSGTLRATVGVLGDSIANGQGDVVGLNGLNIYQRDEMGFIRRALEAASIPYVRLTKPGEKGADFASATLSRMRRALLKTANITHLIDEYGTNDAAAGTSLATMQANALARWNAFAALGIRVYACTLAPRTTSTDYFATTASQTTATGHGTGGVRQLYNDWIRTTPAPLSGYFEVADTVESARNSNLWAAAPTLYTGTSSGATSGNITVAGTPWTVNEWVNGAIKITGGTGSPQGNLLPRSILSNTSNVLTLIQGQSWSPSLGSDTTFTIYKPLTLDGTHPSSEGHRLMAAAINTAVFTA